MALSPAEAAAVAHRYGLTLQDAAGLLGLADNVEEAEQIAADFASPDGQQRALVRNLFIPDTAEAERTSAFLANMFGTGE